MAAMRRSPDRYDRLIARVAQTMASRGTVPGRGRLQRNGASLRSWPQPSQWSSPTRRRRGGASFRTMRVNQLAGPHDSSYTASVMEGSAIPAEVARRPRKSASRRLGVALSAAWAAFIGLLPHVLHHAGPLAGAALFAGFGGSLLFGVLGLIVSIPFLRRMYRRFDTWRAPAIALAVFVGVFSLSTFVIGPKINGEGGSTATKAAPGSPAPSPTEHEEHHE